jgi:hypothetical protein
VWSKLLSDVEPSMYNPYIAKTPQPFCLDIVTLSAAF